jgi:hypothetical protein
MASQMTAQETFTELRTLRDSAGEFHYKRIALADRLLKDRDWVTSPSGGGGDESKALDRLEQDCFGDLCGAIGLPNLLEIYHHVPDVKDWRKHKFDLKKIWAEWKARQTPERRPVPVSPASRQPRPLTTPAQYEELTPVQARREYERAFKVAESDKRRADRLEEENKVLKAENARLKEAIRQFKNGFERWKDAV